VSTPTPSRNLLGVGVLDDPLVRDLLSARVVCVLATFDDGRIHAVPMWFAPNGDDVLLASASGSRKVRNLERDARATLVVHDSRAGFEVCGASIAGAIDVVRGRRARPLVGRVHRRYVTERGEQLPVVREFLDSDDVASRFRPESALTWDERASDANEVLRSSGAALPLRPTHPRP
jgi:PPOX class probable F420-dependent enzyme